MLKLLSYSLGTLKKFKLFKINIIFWTLRTLIACITKESILIAIQYYCYIISQFKTYIEKEQTSLFKYLIT